MLGAAVEEYGREAAEVVLTRTEDGTVQIETRCKPEADEFCNGRDCLKCRVQYGREVVRVTEMVNSSHHDKTTIRQACALSAKLTALNETGASMRDRPAHEDSLRGPHGGRAPGAMQ